MAFKILIHFRARGILLSIEDKREIRSMTYVRSTRRESQRIRLHAMNESFHTQTFHSNDPLSLLVSILRWGISADQVTLQARSQTRKCSIPFEISKLHYADILCLFFVRRQDFERVKIKEYPFPLIPVILKT